MSVFNAAEVMEMGIEKEKKRRDFYRMVAERFTDDKMKNLFTKLENWEESHIKKFTKIRDSVKQSGATDSYPGEFSAYMDNLITDELYSVVNAGDFSRKVKDPLTAIQIGISFEKDAILFFNEIIGFSEEVFRGKIKELIDEEKMHIVYLSKLKSEYIK
ncbi:MAG: ferritin family protein [Candidatus Omnitrophica bacterium]|nr:ferritin family protein [Candidatus Omnitrophota bacterium]